MNKDREIDKTPKELKDLGNGHRWLRESFTKIQPDMTYHLVEVNKTIYILAIKSNLSLSKSVTTKLQEIKGNTRDFPGGAAVKNPPANAGDTGSIPGPGRSHMPRSN